MKKQLFFIFTFCFAFLLNPLAQNNSEQKVLIYNDSINEKPVEIEEITVEQSRSAKITGISSGKVSLHVEGVKSVPSMTGVPDLLKILELTPGVQTSGEGKSNIYVRGGDPGQTLLLYAGIPVYTPGHVLSIFPLFNADHLSTVELVKGGVNAAYGNFLAGAIFAKPKENVPLRTSLKGSVGLLATQATLDLRLNNDWGAYISARKTYLDLLLKPFLAISFNRKSKNNVEDIDYDFYDINATIIGQLSDKNKLLLHFFGGNDKLNIDEDYMGLSGGLNWNQFAFSGKLQSYLTEKMKMEQQIAYSRFQNKMSVAISDIQLQTFSKIESLGYDNKLSYSIKKVNFESGIQYQYYQLYPQEFEKQQSGLNFPDISFGENSAHAFSLFTTSVLKFTPNLTLEPGIRYNFFFSEISKTGSEKKFHKLDFRLLGKYQLSDNNLIRMTLSRNSQFVSKLFPSSTGLSTDFWIAASSEIRPQCGNEFSLGYYHAFADGLFELSSDIYFRTIENALEYTQNFIETDNVVFTEKVLFGTGKAYGIEIMLKKNFGKFSGWFSYSLGRSERNFDEINNGKTFPATHDRTHDFSFTGMYVFNSKWDISLTQILATGNAYTSPVSWYFIGNTPVKEYGKYNNARLPYYNRTDVGVNYWFKENNGINFSVYNVFSISNPLYVSLRVSQVENAQDKVVVDMKKSVLFTIIPAISWRFKF